MPPREKDTNLNLVVPRGSNVDLILRGLNGAVNKLADAIGGGLHAIALALSTPQDNSEQVQQTINQCRGVKGSAITYFVGVRNTNRSAAHKVCRYAEAGSVGNDLFPAASQV